MNYVVYHTDHLWVHLVIIVPSCNSFHLSSLAEPRILLITIGECTTLITISNVLCGLSLRSPLGRSKTVLLIPSPVIFCGRFSLLLIIIWFTTQITIGSTTDFITPVPFSVSNSSNRPLVSVLIYKSQYPCNTWQYPILFLNDLILCLVLLRLGDVLDPHAPVLIQLLGENGESGKIQVKPGVRPEDKFEKGKVYKLIARVADIGKVSTN